MQRRERRGVADEQPPVAEGGDRHARGQLHGVHLPGPRAAGAPALRHRRHQGEAAAAHQPAERAAPALGGALGESST